jgi:hypothetical protein
VTPFPFSSLIAISASTPGIVSINPTWLIFANRTYVRTPTAPLHGQRTCPCNFHKSRKSDPWSTFACTTTFFAAQWLLTKRIS